MRLLPNPFSHFSLNDSAESQIWDETIIKSYPNFPHNNKIGERRCRVWTKCWRKMEIQAPESGSRNAYFLFLLFSISPILQSFKMTSTEFEIIHESSTFSKHLRYTESKWVIFFVFLWINWWWRKRLVKLKIGTCIFERNIYH